MTNLVFMLYNLILLQWKQDTAKSCCCWTVTGGIDISCSHSPPVLCHVWRCAAGSVLVLHDQPEFRMVFSFCKNNWWKMHNTRQFTLMFWMFLLRMCAEEFAKIDQRSIKGNVGSSWWKMITYTKKNVILVDVLHCYCEMLWNFWLSKNVWWLYKHQIICPNQNGKRFILMTHLSQINLWFFWK